MAAPDLSRKCTKCGALFMRALKNKNSWCSACKCRHNRSERGEDATRLYNESYKGKATRKRYRELLKGM